MVGSKQHWPWEFPSRVTAGGSERIQPFRTTDPLITDHGNDWQGAACILPLAYQYQCWYVRVAGRGADQSPTKLTNPSTSDHEPGSASSRSAARIHIAALPVLNERKSAGRMALTITSVEAWPVRAPRTKPMISAGGFAPLRVSDFGIVRVRTSDPGVEGLGEISMNNGRDGAIQTDDVKRLLGPALMDTNPLDVRKALVAMDRAMDGSEPAKAAMEMALWDIAGKVAGKPVYDLLGGRVHDQVFIRWGLAFGRPVPASRRSRRGSRRASGRSRSRSADPGRGSTRRWSRPYARARPTASM